LDPFGRTRQNAWLIDRVRPRLGAVVEPDLHERRHFDGSEPRLAPPHIEQSPAYSVAPRHLVNVHSRIGALGQDPRLLRIAPSAPTPQPRDYLDPLIRVGIMPGLMHGMSAPRIIKSERKSRSAERRKRGGAVVPVTAALDCAAREIPFGPIGGAQEQQTSIDVDRHERAFMLCAPQPPPDARERKTKAVRGPPESVERPGIRHGLTFSCLRQT